jgi:hypothetical protein
MKNLNHFYLATAAAAAVFTSAAAAVDDGPAGNNANCNFGSNYTYIQNYSAGEACSFGVSIGEQKIEVKAEPVKIGFDNSTIEILEFWYNNAVWKTDDKDRSVYCLYSMKWIENETTNSDGSITVTTEGGQWLQLSPTGDIVDNLTRPGLYQLKPGRQVLTFNSTGDLSQGGTLVEIKGNIIDLCEAVEAASKRSSALVNSLGEVVYVLQALALFVLMR